MWFVRGSWDAANLPVFCPTCQIARHAAEACQVIDPKAPAYCAWGCFRSFVCGYPLRRTAVASTTFSTSSRQDKISIASTG